MSYIVALLSCLLFAPIHATTNVESTQEDALGASRITSMCAHFHPHHHDAIKESLVFLDMKSWGNDPFLRFQKLVHCSVQAIESPVQLIPLFHKWTYVLTNGLPKFNETLDLFSGSVMKIHITTKYELVSILTEYMKKTKSGLRDETLSPIQFETALRWLLDQSIKEIKNQRAPMDDKKSGLEALLARLEAAQWLPEKISS